jgi:hypothetical protein
MELLRQEQFGLVTKMGEMELRFYRRFAEFLPEKEHLKQLKVKRLRLRENLISI